MRCHVVGGPRINYPSSGGGFRCPISHNKCKIIARPRNVGVHLAFQSTIASKVAQLTTIVAPRAVTSPLVVVERTRLAGQHGRIVSLRLLLLPLGHLVHETCGDEIQRELLMGRVSNAVIKW